MGNFLAKNINYQNSPKKEQLKQMNFFIESRIMDVPNLPQQHKFESVLYELQKTQKILNSKHF